MGISEACVSERSRVPEELFCQVCMDLVSRPVQTATNHIFCQDCLSQALAVQAVCPVTRSPLQNNATDVKPLAVANPIMHRVWSKVHIRCPNALGGMCTWEGGPADIEQHFEGCPGRVDAVEVVVAEVRRELASVREAADERERTLKTEIERLMTEIESLKTIVRKEKQRRTAFDATYSYGRDRIVELAQVIIRDLERPPADMNTNKIFDCVRKINSDWEREWSDNPEHMHMDFAMLLSVCWASTWFTTKQRNQIIKWKDSL